MRAKKYREEAQRLRGKAVQIVTYDVREEVEKIAKQYEAMAEGIEMGRATSVEAKSQS
jgi:hypothetical protein